MFKTCSSQDWGLCDPMAEPARNLCPWNSSGQNTGVGSPSLLQGIFPTQGSNPGLPNCRGIYHLSHRGSPKIEEHQRKGGNCSWAGPMGPLGGQRPPYILCSISSLKYLSSVQFSRSVISNSLRRHGLQHARLPCPSPTPEVCSNSRPVSWWCHPTISSSVVPFSPAFNPSQHQGLFKWVSSSHQLDKVLELQLQHQSFQWVFRADFL